MPFFARTLYGGLAGAGLGFINEGDLGGIAGGAAMGALAGGAGIWGARRLMGNRTLAGLAQTGFGAVGRGAGRMYRRGFGMMEGGAFAGNIGAGMSMVGQLGMRGAATGAGFIGQNATLVNKWGGKALAGLGVGSSAYIGSTVMASNRGY